VGKTMILFHVLWNRLFMALDGICDHRFCSRVYGMFRHPWSGTRAPTPSIADKHGLLQVFG
jgi:hypothetical protein